MNQLTLTTTKQSGKQFEQEYAGLHQLIGAMRFHYGDKWDNHIKEIHVRTHSLTITHAKGMHNAKKRIIKEIWAYIYKETGKVVFK